MFIVYKNPDRFWGPSSLLFNEYRSYVQAINGWSVKMVTHLHLVRRLRMTGAKPLFPLYALMVWTEKT
jgi:hypothetical protein